MNQNLSLGVSCPGPLEEVEGVPNLKLTPGEKEGFTDGYEVLYWDLRKGEVCHSPSS